MKKSKPMSEKQELDVIEKIMDSWGPGGKPFKFKGPKPAKTAPRQDVHRAERAALDRAIGKEAVPIQIPEPIIPKKPKKILGGSVISKEFGCVKPSPIPGK